MSTKRTLAAGALAAVALMGIGRVAGNYKVVHEHQAVAKPRVTSTAKPAMGIPKVVKVPSVKLPTKPCGGDDVTRNCFHDAARTGDGRGYSYWVDAAGWVTYLDPKKNDTTKRLAWEDDKRAAGWVPWGALNGHQDCYAKVTDASTYFTCWDDYTTTTKKGN